MKAWKLWAVALALLAAGVVFNISLLRAIGGIGQLVALCIVIAQGPSRRAGAK